MTRAVIRTVFRASLLALLPGAVLAQAPQVIVTLDPDGPVTVGTPVAVTATVLVPTWMPDPPVWPDLQIADAITRLPQRATHPVTERVGGDSWSGIARTWEIVPQHAGDYDLGQPQLELTWADPETSQPTAATLDLPALAFTATIPAGAEGMNPFLPATTLTITTAIDGLPAAPKPGDAFTLTLTTTADGPPAILLPPLADRLATPPGLRAYPRQPGLADGAPATRTDAVAYVIEQPGTFVFPATTLDWWNTATAERESAAAPAITVTVPPPPGWRPDSSGSSYRPVAIVAATLAGVAVLATLALLFRRRRARPPSEARLYRALRRAILGEPAPAIRRRLAAWRAALPGPAAPLPRAAETALHALDRSAYGPPGELDSGPAARRGLLSAIDTMRSARPKPRDAVLPGLNPPRPA